MPSVREKSHIKAEFRIECNVQLRAIAGYMYLNRLTKHIWPDTDANLLVSRLKMACLDEIGTDLGLLWTCTDLLINR